MSRLIQGLYLSRNETRAVIRVLFVTLVDVHPPHGYGWTSAAPACPRPRDLAPHSFRVEVKQLFSPGLFGKIVTKHLASEVVLEGAAVPTLWAHDLLHDVVVLVLDLDTETSFSKQAILPELSRRALQDCPA